MLCYNNSITSLEKTDIYKLSFNDCVCFYIGHTGRSSQKRFNEHAPRHNLKNQTMYNNIKSNYVQLLILNNQYLISI